MTSADLTSGEVPRRDGAREESARAAATRRAAARRIPVEGVPDRADPAGRPQLVEEIRRRVAARRGARPFGGSGADIAAELSEVAADHGMVLGVGDLLATATRVGAHLGGLGPLERVLDDPLLTDVLVNGGGRVFLDRGAGLEPADLDLGGEREVRALAIRLAGVAGRRLDEASPWVDARLPGGLRLHAVLPPLAPEGTHLSLRVIRTGGFSLDDLVAAGTVPVGWRQVLETLVTSRVSFLVSGGTGAGKTTLLAALLSLVPPDERLLLVEDVGELRPRHPHVVRLEARQPNVEGRGGVGLDDLVRQALRMRPDRVVVGECRGAEVRDLLAALNTGHEGGCGTVHANSATEVPARLEALGCLAGLTPTAVRVQLAAALDAVVHIRRDGLTRRVVEVGVVVRGNGDQVRVEPALLAAGGSEPGPRSGCASSGRTGPGWRRLTERLSLPGTVPGRFPE